MRRRSPDRSIRTRLARATPLVCAIAVGSIAVACGSDETQTPAPEATPAQPGATEPAPGQTPPAPAAAPSAAEDDGAMPDVTLSEGVLPDGYPSDVPVYPGANIGSTMTQPGLGVFSTFDTDDGVDGILTYYRSELAKNGWSVVDSASGDGVDGTKGNRSVQMRARKNEENRTEIAISITGT